MIYFVDAFDTLKGVSNQENLYSFSVGGPLSINAKTQTWKKKKRHKGYIPLWRFFMLMID